MLEQILHFRKVDDEVLQHVRVLRSLTGEQKGELPPGSQRAAAEK